MENLVLHLTAQQYSIEIVHHRNVGGDFGPFICGCCRSIFTKSDDVKEIIITAVNLQFCFDSRAASVAILEFGVNVWNDECFIVV